MKHKFIFLDIDGVLTPTDTETERIYKHHLEMVKLTSNQHWYTEHDQYPDLFYPVVTTRPHAPHLIILAKLIEAINGVDPDTKVTIALSSTHQMHYDHPTEWENVINDLYRQYGIDYKLNCIGLVRNRFIKQPFNKGAKEERGYAILNWIYEHTTSELSEKQRTDGELCQIKVGDTIQFVTIDDDGDFHDIRNSVYVDNHESLTTDNIEWAFIRLHDEVYTCLKVKEDVPEEQSLLTKLTNMYDVTSIAYNDRPKTPNFDDIEIPSKDPVVYTT